jgi:hypothetical protein
MLTPISVLVPYGQAAWRAKAKKARGEADTGLSPPPMNREQLLRMALTTAAGDLYREVRAEHFKMCCSVKFDWPGTAPWCSSSRICRLQLMAQDTHLDSVSLQNRDV